MGKGCEIVSIKTVKTEFLLGSQDINAYKIKEEYYNSLISSTLDLRGISNEKAMDLITEYGSKIKKNIGYVDFSLGLFLKNYGDKCLVLTRNYIDFPGTMFNCEGIFSMVMDKTIRTYGFYGYGK